MISPFQIFILLGIVNFSQALPAYIPVQNSSSSALHSTLTTFTTFLPTLFPSMPIPQNTSIAATPSSISTSTLSPPCKNRTLALSPTLSTARGILVVTTTVDRHHFVEVAPVTVTTIEKVTETTSEMQRVTETQTQKITETKMVTITASGGMERVTETSVVTVTESGVTGTEEAVGSTIILLPLPSSSITEAVTTMTTIAIITTDVTSVVTAILMPSTTEVIDVTTTEQATDIPTSQVTITSTNSGQTTASDTTAPELTSSAQPAPIPTTTETTIVKPTSTAEPAPVITATPEPTSEVDTGLRSSTLLRISISRLSPPPAPAFETVAPIATETPIVTPPPVAAGDDDSETPSNLPDWDDVKGFASTFAGA
ncbi:uncharacterized protein H6S33_000983 [Morchella sextelata]|uniref:uncharacterized protein n=1 Tax=Morchella sextelata TaxID=1174677 RepID=UPI001D038793|nr:uncharacterized protein H6S33_000983 [Morchella sextelata]KAH0615347.1 hypothetical protein H6S33_000983 [Morchella sextelata]